MLEKKKNACTLSPCVPLKRKRTTPTNEAKAYAIRKTYLNQHVLLKRINMKNILFAYAFLASGGSREPWHFVLKKYKNPVLTDVNLGTPCLKNYSIYLFFSALAASIILFA